MVNGRDQIDTTWNVGSQIDAIEMLMTKLKYGVKDKNQLCNLP